MVFKDCRIITIQIKALITKSTIQRKFKNRNQITARFLFLDEFWRERVGMEKKSFRNVQIILVYLNLRQELLVLSKCQLHRFSRSR